MPFALLPSYCRLPMCRMAASSLEISQFSVSVNMRTFIAERILAYSLLSSLPSQVVQLPWGGKQGTHCMGQSQGAPWAIRVSPKPAVFCLRDGAELVDLSLTFVIF